MKNLAMRLLVVTVVLTVAFGLATAQTTVNVTFLINTSTVPDTIGAGSLISIAGNNAALGNWGTTVNATNIGGDYWSKTIALNAGDTVHWKFRVGDAWESNIKGNVAESWGDPNNRKLIVGQNDTTLPVQFINFSADRKDQYWRPWGVSNADTTYIWFRTNMQATTKPFNELTDTVGVRGDKISGASLAPDFGWSPTRYLAKEASGSGLTYPGKNFWSGVIKLPKTKFVGGDTVAYKYIIGYDWGADESNNRQLILPKTQNDTTIYFTWYNNEAPITKVVTDTVDVTFSVNMTTASQKGSFALSDSVFVSAGFFATAQTISGRSADTTIKLIKQGGTQIYAGTVRLITKLGDNLDYQYYRNTTDGTSREYFYNFDYAGDVSAEAERRQIVVTTKPAFTVTDNVVSVTSPRRQPYFTNRDTLQQQVTVRWEVDVRPAYYTISLAGKTLTDIQGTFHVTPAVIDSIIPWGVAMNGPASGTNVVGLANNDWATWGATLIADPNHKMFDDGTNGDQVAGDSIYTRQITYKTAATKGQTFKFGIKGGDNESNYGLNHLENLDDTNPTFTVRAQWGSINPKFYNAWDFTNKQPQVPTSVDANPVVPQQYSLGQNYPNPFNPSTKIEFSLPATGWTTLKVYNLLGQVVATLADGEFTAGKHIVTLDGRGLSSGVYFYQIKSGTFTGLKRMVVLK